ncbi:MAG: tRNA epoxyqueuosine(34) reductase QueG [Paludibacter sp.]|nr:tRNA epoxyqueuosine(34) reductase QueG [Paludibacter sp.]
MNQFIKNTALSLGFDACGIAEAGFLAEDAAFMRSWIDAGNHGEMNYLARNFEKRTDPRILVPGCKSVVVVLMNYYPAGKQQPLAPQIAKYAYSAIDYHAVLKEKLTALEQKITTTYGAECVSHNHQHLFVDSAPVLERRWAERGGLGWIGKHTQLINPTFGSYTFIGILMLNIETMYDSPVVPRCGTCTRCIDACPTHALTAGTLDARRCISYLTIESKNDIPAEFLDKLSNCAIGCDICADVCPWNKKWAKPNSTAELLPAEDMLQWDKQTWLHLSEKEFNTTFRQSAIKRAGFQKLKDNIQSL